MVWSLTVILINDLVGFTGCINCEQNFYLLVYWKRLVYIMGIKEKILNDFKWWEDFWNLGGLGLCLSLI